MAKSIEKARPGTMKKVLKYIGKYKALLPISVLLACVNVALTLYIPIIIGQAIDMIGPSPINFDGILLLIAKAAVLIGIGALAQWLMSTINNQISFGVVKDIRNDAFGKIQSKMAIIFLNPLDKAFYSCVHKYSDTEKLHEDCTDFYDVG